MSLLLTGGAERIQLADSIDMVRNVAGATVCAWVYRTASMANSTLVSLSKSDSRISPRMNFFIYGATGNLRTTGRALDSDTIGNFESTLVCPLNTWVFVSSVMDFSSRYIRLGLNGSFQQSGTIGTWTAGNCSNTPTLANAICARDADNYELNGRAEDVRIYNRILSDGEINTIMACMGTDDIRFGLQSRYLLNEKHSGFVCVGGEIIYDMVGNYNGLIESTPSFADSIIQY